MSGTYRKVLVLAALFAAPVEAMAFDFDKELAKQNNISVEVLSKKSQQDAQKAGKGDKNLRVTLIAKK